MRALFVSFGWSFVLSCKLYSNFAASRPSSAKFRYERTRVDDLHKLSNRFLIKMLTCPRLLSSNRELKYQTSICLCSKYNNISINRCCAILHSILQPPLQFSVHCWVHTTSLLFYIVISRLLKFSHFSLLDFSHNFFTPPTLPHLSFSSPLGHKTRACLQCSLTLRGKTPTNAHLHQRHSIHQRDESFRLQ